MMKFNVTYSTPYGAQQGTIAYSWIEKKGKIINWDQPKGRDAFMTEIDCKTMSQTGLGCL